MNRRLATVATCLLIACGDPPLSPGEQPLPELTVSPATAPPGGLLELSGFDAAAIGAGLSVSVGGHAAPALLAEGGRVLTAVPLFVGADGTVLDPPTEPVDVVLLDGATPVAGALGTFMVAPRPTAPGAADAVAGSLDDLVESLGEIADVLAPEPGEEQAFATVTLEALRDLLFGDHEQSLTRQLDMLDAASPEQKALVEGWLAASGIDAQMRDVADQLSLLAGAMKSASTTGGPLAVESVDDFGLATRMQLHAMIRAFGTQVLGQTAATWGSTVGLAAGTAGLVVAVPFVGTVSAALGVTAFAVNQVAVAYLPAKIDSFELVLSSPYVFSGEVADAEIHIVASNSPPAIGVLDLTDLVLTTLGIAAGGGDSETFRGIVVSVANYFLDRVRSLMSAYAAAYPNAGIDTDVASIPDMRWEATVTDLRFATPRSLTPNLIDANGSGVLAWRAGIDAEGEGRIYASVATGPDVLVIPLPPGIEYNAGAFGEDVPNTETVSIQVGRPLVATASMADTIAAGGVNGLEVRAGTLDALGDTTWTADLAVTVTAVGGTVDPASGVTDADGRFDTFVTLAPGSDSVVVTAEVTAANGFTVAASAEASTQRDELEILTSFPNILEPGRSRSLGITVFRRPGGGPRDPEPFADVALTVSGGAAAETVGATDDHGEWETEIEIDSTAAAVSVHIHATSLDGLTVDTTITATNYEALPIRVVSHVYRAWLNTGGTAGPSWRLYNDNFSNLRRPVTAVNWSYSSSGDRNGKTCTVTTSLTARAELAFDPATGLLTGWSSTSEAGSVGSAQGLTASDNPSCYGNTQLQHRLRFAITDGSWRISWSGEQSGADATQHPNWSAASYFDSPDGERVDSPPTTTFSGSVVLGPGEYGFWMRPQLSGSVGNPGAASSYTATGSHTLEVTFERVSGSAAAHAPSASLPPVIRRTPASR